MSFLNFNGLIFSAEESIFNSTNGAFRAGEGLIETMLLYEGQIPLFVAHYERLANSMQVLQFEAPFRAEQLRSEIKKMLGANQNPGKGIVRLQVFHNNKRADTDFLLEYIRLEKNASLAGKTELRVGIAKSVVMPDDRLANLKTSSRLRYVMARTEAHGNNWDDALLQNRHNRITESTLSNIFWIKNKTIYTPPLKEGCIAGIMRKLLLEHQHKDYMIREEQLSLNSLADADEIFLTNAVRGIQPVISCNGIPYKSILTHALSETFNFSLHL